MTFVPIVTTPTPAPSRRAKELGHRISQLIEQFQLEEPDTKNAEVHMALALAKQSVGSSGPAAGVVVMLVGIAVAGILVALLTARSAGGAGAGSPVFLPVVIGAGVIVIVAAAALALSIANRDR